MVDIFRGASEREIDFTENPSRGGWVGHVCQGRNTSNFYIFTHLFAALLFRTHHHRSTQSVRVTCWVSNYLTYFTALSDSFLAVSIPPQPPVLAVTRMILLYQYLFFVLQGRMEPRLHERGDVADRTAPEGVRAVSARGTGGWDKGERRI